MAKHKKKSGLLNFICNIIWIIFGGLILSVAWLILGLLLCITIIGIPFGKQCFKFAGLSLAPFGSQVDLNFGAHPIANILWLIFIGWEMCLGYITAGIFLCCTIIGIPFGIQIFKFGVLSLIPFGAKVR